MLPLDTAPALEARGMIAMSLSSGGTTDRAAGPRLARRDRMLKQFHAHRGLDEMPANGPRLLLADHHRGIENAYRSMLSTTYADDSRDLVREFRCFERAILEHLAAEEDVILPSYELFDPEDAELIRAEHARIREELALVGIETDLHTMRADRMKGLIEALQAHSAHEDRHMYPWAQVHLPLSARRTLFVRLGRSLRTLVAQHIVL